MSACKYISKLRRNKASLGKKNVVSKKGKQNSRKNRGKNYKMKNLASKNLMG